jgi:hypothetical protein
VLSVGGWIAHTGCVAMSGEQWLERVFRPVVQQVVSLRESQPDDTLPQWAVRWLGARLASQVEALKDTGVLSEDQERAARDSLDTAGMLPETRSQSQWSSSTAFVAMARRGEEPQIPDGLAPVVTGPAELVGVLAGPRVLGMLDGRALTLVCVELWSHEVAVDLFTETSAEFRAERGHHERAREDAIRRERRGEAVDVPRRRHPDSPLGQLRWQLSDARGTEYHRAGGSGQTSHDLDRIRIVWRPAAPPGVRLLTLTAMGSDGVTVTRMEIPVPEQ